MIKKILLAVAAAFVLYTFYFIWAQAQEKPVTYNLVTPRVGTIENTITATGKLEPRTEISVKPKITGTIKTLDVAVGQKVVKGQRLATVRVVPEQSVLSTARTAVDVAEVALDNAEKEYNRCKGLYEKQVLSLRELQASQAAYQTALHELEGCKNAYNVALNGYDKSFGDITEVRSPIDGIVMDLPSKVGTAVVSVNDFSDGTTVAIVAQMDDIVFKGTIDETNAAELRNGQEMHLTIGNMKDREIEGELEIVSPLGKSQNGTVQFDVRASVNLPQDMVVRAGYSANADFVIAKKEGALIIDEGCVEYEDGKTYVQCLISDPKDEKKQEFEKREVVLGVSNGIEVEIISGIDKDTKLRGLKK